MNSRTRGTTENVYFELPHPVAMIFVIGGLGLTALTHYNPGIIPYDYMGPLGTLVHYLSYQQPRLMMIVWYAALAAHVGEGTYAYTVICPSKGITGFSRVKWGVSTSMFGYFSLRLLQAYHPSSS